MSHAELRLALGSEEAVATAMQALAPDNDGHAGLRADGDVLVVTADSATTMGLLRTLDDVLGCLRALGHD